MDGSLDSNRFLYQQLRCCIPT